jgi:peptidoglycan-associated lipoprotein
MTSFRTRNLLLVFFFSALVSVSCRKNTPAPPPPPVAVTPNVPAPAPAITLRAEPATINRGQGTMLQWQAQNAATVRIEPGIGEVPTMGNRQINPTSSVTYTATASGPGGMATDVARITVNEPPPPATIAPTRTNPPDVTIEALFEKNVQEVYFDYDKADILPGEVPKLQNAAAWLKENGNVRFTIEGHCDERGSEEYNIGLGDRRANAVKEFLASQGIPGSRMNSVSYGEERPQCRDETEACFQKNRRAAFTLTR